MPLGHEDCLDLHGEIIYDKVKQSYKFYNKGLNKDNPAMSFYKI